MINKYDYDVLYIGVGYVMFDGVVLFVKIGVCVGVIESGLIGGICFNCGCNVKIIFDEFVKLMWEIVCFNDILSSVLIINWMVNVVYK